MDPQPNPPPPVTPVVPAPVVTPSPKWPWLLVGLVLLIIVGMGGIFLGRQMAKPVVTPTPTPPLDQTANWQEYNSTFGFSLKIPPGYITRENQLDPTSPTTLLSLSFNETSADQGPNDFGVFVVSSTLAERLEEMKKDNFIKSDVSKTVNNNVWTIAQNSFYSETQYLIENDGKVFVLGGKNLQLLDRILSTFKFVSSSTSITTPSTAPLAKTVISYRPQSGWATYDDSVAKFSIQYNSVPTPPYNSHFALGTSVLGKNVVITACLTHASGPYAGQEVCLSGYDITVFNNYNGGSRREWLNVNNPNVANCDNQFEDVAIAGKNALGVLADDCSSYIESFILIPNGSQMLVIHAISDYRKDAWFKDTLATFKYL